MKTEKEKQPNLYPHSHFHNTHESHLHCKGAANKTAHIYSRLGPQWYPLSARAQNSPKWSNTFMKAPKGSSKAQTITSPFYTALCSDGADTAVVPEGQQPSAGFGNVPMGTALRPPPPGQTHLQGWMVSWVPFPKTSLSVTPPVFTP